MNTEQYRAVRSGAGVIRRTARGLLAVEGEDSADFLQGLLTNDVAALAAGAGCYAAYLTPQGRMLADMDVFNLGGRILLDVDGAGAPGAGRPPRQPDLHGRGPPWPTGAAPMRVAASTVRRRPAWPRRRWSGWAPAAKAATAVRGLAPHACLEVQAGGMAVTAARGDELGVPGLVLIAGRDDAGALDGALAAAGSTEIDASTADTVRVESGRPAFPVDMDTETIPLEAGIEGRAISLTKGCYVGQEVIIRVLHRGGGRIARRLVGLTLAAPAGAGSPDAQVPVRGAGISHDGRPVGQVTSAVFSPALERVIALGYVPRALAEAGTRLAVEQAGGPAGAVVTGLPFVPTVGAG